MPLVSDAKTRSASPGPTGGDRRGRQDAKPKLDTGLASDARGKSPAPRRPSFAGSGAANAPPVNEATIRRIWQKLDRNNSGTIQVKDLVSSSTFIQTECPRLLHEYETIAKGGVVKYQDVRRLLLGLMDSSLQKTNKTRQPELSEAELLSLFHEIKNEEGYITPKALVEHKGLVMSKFPALVNDFERIDLDKDSKITWEDLKVFVGGTSLWLEHELQRIVGLEDLKEQVRSFYRSVSLDQMRRHQGHDVQGLVKAPHMIFQGNPGTGKTSLGRVMAKLLHRIGVISTPSLKEVQRPDLVGEHVGQTAPKTQTVINDAKSGVLFIDEAYRLTSVESKNDFGREAVETLMAAMNESPGKAPVMIFAGYSRDMANFMRANEGLYRRIGYTFEFTDYTPADLAKILEFVVLGKGFQLEPFLLEDDRAELGQIISSNTLPRTRALMNGGLCERIFDAAKQNLDARDDPENPSVIISKDDLRSACLAIPPPPEPGQAWREDLPQPLAPSAPQQHAMNRPNGVTKDRNLWFHIGSGHGFRKGGCGCFSNAAPFVSVRLDKKEIHTTRSQALRGGCANWGETRIVPYRGEALVEFVVFDNARFVGSATVALAGIDVFDGGLELLASDRPTGQLEVKVGWQFLAGCTGGDLLTACVDGAVN